jgi:glyoxylase-like metal-dependent hydrolase (beta-lactamase superfamily II)
MGFSLDVFSDNPYLTNCWMLAREGGEEALVIDPGFEAERVHGILSKAGLKAVAALATHGHGDHVGAVMAFCGNDIPLYIHAEDELALSDAAAWGAGYGTYSPGRPPLTRTVKDGDTVEAAGFALEVVHTPGHTPGSVCYRVDDSVFSGDLVFAGSIGRYDFPNSSEEAMFASLRRFLELPDDVRVLPGHMATTTVGRERRSNPFLLQLV